MPHRLKPFKRKQHLLAAAMIFAISTQVCAEEADPVATREALAALMASSNSPIPENSTCHGNYGQSAKPTVKDLIAMQLAYLYAGENTIEGRCLADSCAITIKHASGEDRSSATITFKLRHGRANAASLRCLITP